GGQTDTIVTNPAQQIVIAYDVSDFQGATGAYVEFSQPGGAFQQQNGLYVDPRRFIFGSQAQVRGTFVVQRQLPWGIYQYHVIALGGQGNYAVSRFSNASVLRVQPQGWGSPPGRF
ncbi:MAG: hypothetical protein HY075_15210, partial [Deltaproteobacteria bacterium]|nr:hypothetical protein [Deltaproteobacteria bacterium]